MPVTLTDQEIKKLQDDLQEIVRDFAVLQTHVNKVKNKYALLDVEIERLQNEHKTALRVIGYLVYHKLDRRVFVPDEVFVGNSPYTLETERPLLSSGLIIRSREEKPGGSPAVAPASEL